MKNNSMKKLLSLLLVFTMLVSMFPAVLAEGEEAALGETVAADSLFGEELGEESESPEIGESPEEDPSAEDATGDATLTEAPQEETAEPAEELGEVPEEPAEEAPEIPEEPAEEPAETPTDGEGDPAEPPADEEAAVAEESEEESEDEDDAQAESVCVTFVSAQEIRLTVYAGETPVAPAEEAELAEATATETAEDPAEDETAAMAAMAEGAETDATASDAEEAPDGAEETVFRAVYLLTPGVYVWSATADGFRAKENVPLEVAAGSEPVTVTVSMKEALPYGFKGLPEDYELSEEQLEEKRVLTDEGILAAVQSGAGEYVEGEVLFSAESEEYARMVAEAYNAELAEFSGYIGKLLLTDATVAEAVECAADMEMPLPAVEPNWIVSVDPVMLSEGVSFDTQMQAAAYSGLMWQDWIDNTANPDSLLRNPAGSYQYQHDIVHSYGAWGVTTGSSNVIVAVVDTGVDYNHPDLAGKVIKGDDYVDGDNDPMDENGHGTHVAGIIAATMGNGKGGAGIAPGVSILAVRVMDENGGGNEYAISQGIDYAWKHGAKIINMSINSKNYPSQIHGAIRRATVAGATVIVSMGNDASNIKAAPAYFDEVIAVAATDISGARAPYSNYGDWCDVSAPGSAIWSTTWSTTTGSTYVCWNGTSMATPVVSGVAALYLSYYLSYYGNPVFDQSFPPYMRSILMKACNKISGKGMGAGVIDAAKLFGVTKGGYYSRVFKANGTEITDGTVPANGYITLRSAGGTSSTARFLYSTDGQNPAVLNGAVVHGAEVSDKGHYDAEQGCFVLPLSEFEPGRTVELRIMELNEAGMAGEVSCLELRITEPENTEGESGGEARNETRVRAATVRLNGEIPELKPNTKWSIPFEIKDAEGKLLNPENADFRWNVSDESVLNATTQYDEQTGESSLILSAKTEGSVTVTGMPTDGSEELLSFTVSVNASLQDIMITGQEIMAPGTSATFKATLSPKNATNKKLVWSVHSSGGSAPPYGVSINPMNGKVTVESWVSVGTRFYVYAQPELGSAYCYQHYVRVAPKATGVDLYWNGQPVKNGQTLTLNSADIPSTSRRDNTATLKAVRVNGGSYAGEGIEWTVNKWEVADLWYEYDQSDNLSLIIRASHGGKCTLTAKALDGSNKSIRVNVNVTVPASSITVIPKTLDNRWHDGIDKAANNYVPIGYGKSQGNTAVLGTTYGTPTVKKVSWSWDMGVLNDSGNYVANSSLTDYAARNRYVSINNSGNLSVKPKLEQAVRYNYNYYIRVTARTTDGTNLMHSVYYRPIPQIVKVEIINNSGYLAKKDIIYQSWGEGTLSYEVVGLSKYGKYYYRELPNFSVTSSNPDVAGGTMSYGFDEEYGWYAILTVYRNATGKKGTAKITVKTTDGTNKSASITIQVK
ncbi:MAG: S8 family serine peptidase [Oscillospiraceae bacterium]|nr:S8 family serine peptidase [Oscillospiraceae bacterium]